MSVAVAAQQRPPVYGQCASSNTSPDERVAACTTIIRSGRDSGRNLALSYFYRGLAWDKKGELEIALSDFHEAIRIDGSFAAAYNARGVVLAKRGENERAISDYNEAIRLDPNGPAAYGNRGNAYGRQCDFDRALSDFQRVIERAPNVAAGYGSRGAMFLNKGDIDDLRCPGPGGVAAGACRARRNISEKFRICMRVHHHPGRRGRSRQGRNRRQRR
jgi:tetratricopeptide (TPR) repeat protein